MAGPSGSGGGARYGLDDAEHAALVDAAARFVRAAGGGDAPEVKTVLAALRNVRASPTEPKFQRLRLGNARVDAVVEKQGLGLLHAVGFAKAVKLDTGEEFAVSKGTAGT